MSDEIREIANCPNCPKGCPKDSLSCDRGRRFFGLEALEDSGSGHKGDHHHGDGHRFHKGHGEEQGFHGSESGNPLVQALSKASAIAEHKSQKMRMHGKDDDSMFDVLTEEERKELSVLLDKLLSEWARLHAAHHSR